MPNIHQEVTLSAAPARIYQALVDSKSFGELTGAPASAKRVFSRSNPRDRNVLAGFSV